MGAALLAAVLGLIVVWAAPNNFSPDDSAAGSSGSLLRSSGDAGSAE